MDEPEEELNTLRSWINEHEGDPMYAFGGRSRVDPDSQTECIGDDNVRASEYGISNLKIVGDRLVDWTTTPGENYGELDELYGEFLSVWRRYINHVITNVGGIKHELKTSNQDGAVFTYVTKREQQDALDFIGKQVIETPMWLIPEEIISMVGYQGAVDKLHAYQYDMLESILSDRRMYRLSEAEVYGADVLSVSEVITQVIDKVFDGDADRPRRQLQRQLVELLLSKIDEEASDLCLLYTSPSPRDS